MSLKVMIHIIPALLVLKDDIIIIDAIESHTRAAYVSCLTDNVLFMDSSLP
jgi:AAA15 family ATPase/GTPase